MPISPRRTLLWPLAVLLLGAVSCRADHQGLTDPWGASGGPDGSQAGSDGARTDAVADGARGDARPEAPPLMDESPPGVLGPPALVGCADGSREGFPDVAAWQRIAGCSGGFQVPGLFAPAARTPQCQRMAGNGSPNPRGLACSVADLCAPGWHVCEGPEEVRRSSPTECESAVPAGHAVFFVTRGGATPFGLCLADPSLPPQANDLHGCGNLGQPEGSGCQPLDRRLSFVECGRSAAWACGDEGHHLDEGNLVTKTSAAQGGALCCRD